MKIKKLDNFVRRHFAERKVFYNRTLNKNFGGAQFYGSQRTKSMFSHIFFFNLSPYKWKTDKETTEKYLIFCKTTRSKFLVPINFFISVTEKKLFVKKQKFCENYKF